VAETILLVEDDPSLRKLVQRILVKLGYEVIVAESGEAAITRAGEHQGRIDLLVTDVFMPDMAGPKLASQLQPSRPALRVLYVSGTNEGLARNGMLREDEDFLQKPFTTDEFSKKLREILDR
jgi:two-component system, cell cycle sensor histidine kinase and response regulator CckA